MARKKKKSKESEGSPAWMTTFGDMMTLLLVFFVLLYSFSEMDVQKFQGFISSFQGQIGVLEGGRTVIDEDYVSKGSAGQQFNPARKNFERIMGDMEKFIRENNLEGQVEVSETKRGLVVRLTGEVLYDLGEAVIKPTGQEVLDGLVDILNGVSNDIAVEGHTDDWPINNDNFPSNWELSTTRATNIIRYFSNRHNIAPIRLSAAGFAEFRPLVPNDTRENRAKNRRVEIVILSSITQEAQVKGGS
ncbi:MAG: flagellar motor protein MotB [bacterium]